MVNKVFRIAKNVLKISLFKTIYFNLHYLPFKQAIKLPILIAHGVSFKKLKGKITIDPSSIHFGICKIGFPSYGFHTKYDKTIIEINGGEIILRGYSYIGKGTLLSIGKAGRLIINENVFIGGNDKLICYDEIEIGKNTRISWDVTIIDTDFHQTINIHTQERSLAKKPIYIGNNNWIGFGTTIMKGTRTPNFCIIAAKSVLIKEYQYDEYIVLGGNPAKKIKEGIYRDLNSYVE